MLVNLKAETRNSRLPFIISLSHGFLFYATIISFWPRDEEKVTPDNRSFEDYFPPSFPTRPSLCNCRTIIVQFYLKKNKSYRIFFLIAQRFIKFIDVLIHFTPCLVTFSFLFAWKIIN